MFKEVNMARPSASVLIACVGLLSVAISLYPTTIAQAQQQDQQQQSANGSGTPYWRRHGCFKVGHTRTISIPGCLKFNLSTNACRGYCMSYSVPAISDSLHFSELQRSDGLDKPPEMGSNNKATEENSKQTEDASPGELVGAPEAGGITTSRDSNEQQLLEKQQQSNSIISESPTASLSSVSTPFGQVSSQPTVKCYHSCGSAAAATIVPENRDLVTSYSQCCSMMETEEVVVNLRCGANEIRRLVFKSAKTCECFFCKHG